MAEAEYGELFDFYCVKILAELYKNRGRAVEFYSSKLAEEGPPNAKMSDRQEAASAALRWLSKYGYAANSGYASYEASFSITPLGIAAYGRPFPGKEKVSTGNQAAALIGEIAKSGLTSAGSESISQIMGNISISGFLSWAGARLSS